MRICENENHQSKQIERSEGPGGDSRVLLSEYLNISLNPRSNQRLRCVYVDPCHPFVHKLRSAKPLNPNIYFCFERTWVLCEMREGEQLGRERAQNVNCHHNPIRQWWEKGKRRWEKSKGWCDAILQPEKKGFRARDVMKLPSKDERRHKIPDQETKKRRRCRWNVLSLLKCR